MTTRATCFALGMLLAAAPVHASPPATALSWTRLPGAEACVDAPELARGVETRIGDVLVTPAHADLSIEGRIAPRPGGGWRAVVALARTGGAITSQRTLETGAASCRVLDASLALVIALLIDPAGTPAAPAPATTPEVVVREVRVEVPVFVREPWHVDLAARGDVEVGVLAHAALGGALAVVVAPPRLPRFEVAAFYDAAQHVGTDLPDRTVTESFAGGSLAVCPVMALGRLDASACGGVRIARFAWAGHNFEQNIDDALLVPAVVLDARVELPIGAGFGLVGGAGVRVPLRDVALRYERSPAAGAGEVTIDDAAALSLWVGFGVVARVL